jgi:hypothetical protein
MLVRKRQQTDRHRRTACRVRIIWCMMINLNLLLLIDSGSRCETLSTQSWTSRALALNETCLAFGVSWFPVHFRHYSARLSWRLSDICGQAQRPPRAGRSHNTHSARPTRPPLVRAYPERVRNEIMGRQKPSLGLRGRGHGQPDAAQLELAIQQTLSFMVQ